MLAVGSAVVGWLWSWSVGVALAAVAALVFGMALMGCGHQAAATAYQGSRFPECGSENWIWPWNF